MLARYTLAMPFLQAFAGVAIPLSVASMLWMRVPVVIALISFLPAVPTLVTVGRTDWITPVECSEKIAGLMPDARLVVFEHSGHSPQIEEADAWTATVRAFLDEVYPA